MKNPCKLLLLVLVCLVSFPLLADEEWFGNGLGPGGSVNLRIKYLGNTPTGCTPSMQTKNGPFLASELQQMLDQLFHVVAYPEADANLRFEVEMVASNNLILDTKLLVLIDGTQFDFTMSSVFAGQGSTIYRTTVSLPREVAYQSPGRSLRLNIQRSNGETIISTANQLIVTGSRWRESPSWTTLTPELPQLILHNPPGDQSFAFFEENKEICYGYGISLARDLSGTAWASARIGKKGSLGIGVETEYEVYGEVSASLEVGIRARQDQSYEMCIKANSRYETAQGNPSITGRDGDLYLGSAIRYRYGFAERVSMNGCEPYFEKDFMLIPDQTLTKFIYTEHFIKNTELPALRDRLAMVMMVGDSSATQTTRDQIEAWENALAMNDEIYQAGSYPQVTSFSGGTGNNAESFTATTSSLRTIETNIYMEAGAAIEAGASVDGTGGAAGVRVRARIENGRSSSISNTNTNTIGYSLRDEGTADRFTFGVGSDDAFGTPIFLLDSLASNTSCPYEGGRQMDQPYLEFVNGSTVDSLINVPIGTPATFRINACNTSDFTRTYFLRVKRGTNPSGAGILAFGPDISNNDLGVQLDTIPPNSCLENAVITIEQLNTTILDYEDIQLVLYAECQPATDPIESTISLTTRFGNTTSTNNRGLTHKPLQLLPNPSNGYFEINTSSLTAGGDLQLFDTAGRGVHLIAFNRYSVRISVQLPDLPIGVFLVTLSSQGHR
ncbi:MAG: T9SS type A sorting domain-containing protein, partial [Bacteroidota bacterium]